VSWSTEKKRESKSQYFLMTGLSGESFESVKLTTGEEEKTCLSGEEWL